MASVLSFAIGVFILYIVGSILMFPIKMLFRMIGSALAGGILLVVVNLFGSLIGLNIEITPLNAIIVGILGIPGVVLLLIFGRK